MTVIDEAFSILFPEATPEEKDVLESWEKAKKILRKFNISVLGEQRALAALCETIHYVYFPSQGLANLYCGLAKRKILAILRWDRRHRLTIDESFTIQMYADRGESVEEIRSRWKSEKKFQPSFI